MDDIMFEEGSSYASSPPGMIKSPPGDYSPGMPISNGNPERAGMRTSNPIAINRQSYSGGQTAEGSWSTWAIPNVPSNICCMVYTPHGG